MTDQLTAETRLSEMPDGDLQQLWSLQTDIGWNAPGPYSGVPTMTDWVQRIQAEMDKRGLDKFAPPAVCDSCQGLAPRERYRRPDADFLAGWVEDGMLYGFRFVPHNIGTTEHPCTGA